MPYYVTGSDGNEYGPVDRATLQTWVQENRILPSSQLRDDETGHIGPASMVPGLFPQAAPIASPQTVVPSHPTYHQPDFSQPPQPMVGYPRQVQSRAYVGDRFPWRAFVYPVLGLLSFFGCGGFGVLFGIYGIIYSFQVQSAGSKYGIPAIIFSVVCMTAIVAGYFLGLRGIAMR